MQYYYHEQLTNLDDTGFGVLYDRNPSTYMPSHWHNAVELLLLVEGAVTCKFSHSTFHVGPGDLFLINSHDAHETWVTPNAQYLCVHILPSAMCRYQPNFDQLSFSLKFDPDDPEKSEALDTIRAIHGLPGLEFTGTYTHFACGDGSEEWEQAFTRQQFDRFRDALDHMEKAGLPIGLRHCCSTGSSLLHPEYRLDMVRLGMLPMGMSFSDESVAQLGLIPAMTWVSWLIQTEDLPAGEAVSYGCIFRAEKPMRVGMVSCGYADGYRRACSNKTHVLIGGKKVRVLGRIAMDYMLVDITQTDCKVGDSVILLGTDGVNSVTAQELMAHGESVSGEVTCAISQRVRRVYTEA